MSENPASSGVQTRQLRDDIRFMKSESGYEAPIETFREGRKAYYRYSDPTFSINLTPLNQTEAEKLRNALSILQRFEGSPEFEWVHELIPMLKDQFGLKDNSRKVMGYDSNIDYSGYEHITPLFNAIVNQRVLEITYKPFDKQEYTFEFHPYFLKQYNNRWFVFGRNERFDINEWNLALDRIRNIKEVDVNYQSDEMDWEEFFFDMIGVTKTEGSEIQEVELEFSKEQAPYIKTKPLHPTQRSTTQDNGVLNVKLSVIVNYELEMKLLAYGEKVRVVSPKSLVESIKERLKKAVAQY
ncbi:helix-turn-helix transcriptional regulator [Sanyastnella coralliicola]|uniref:helix-turn-helix transcriptional regulator n=1 Tax=Sanyastnella coralliicola TaxID=3069118 RepID=UPI0027BAF0DE|nr:WYL domain-containing protein [Longitalea sp. SCSIO 12813]